MLICSISCRASYESSQRRTLVSEFIRAFVASWQKSDQFPGDRSKVVIFNSLFWKPYDSRFEDILETMQYHQDLLKMELSLYAHRSTHLKLAQEHEQLKEELQSNIHASAIEEEKRCKKIQQRLDDLAVMLVKADQDSIKIERSLVGIDTKFTAQIKAIATEVTDTLRAHLKGIFTALNRRKRT